MCMIVQQFPVITNNNAITERRGIGGGWAGERGWKVGKKLFYKHEKEAVTRESLEGVERTSGSTGERIESITCDDRWNDGEVEVEVEVEGERWFSTSAKEKRNEARDELADLYTCARHTRGFHVSLVRRSLVRLRSTRIAGEPCGRCVARARSAHARARRAYFVLYVTCYGRPVPLAKA